jgi:polyphenol oxidase
MTATQLAEPYYRLGEHFAIDLPGARGLFTTRRGGFSRGPYSSLNLGRLTDDDPVAVERNRTAVEAQAGGWLCFVRQVHGSTVCQLDRAQAERAHAAEPGQLRPADGQVTATRGLAPAVLTADCLPVVIAGRGAVAVVHAGWRGLAAGILDIGASALEGLGVEGELSAAIGPGAGPCCYAVGDEVHEAFADYPDEVHRGANVDLPEIASEQLRRAGVARIHDLGMCTICSDPDLFFSHRRDHGVTGRQAGLAWLT